MECFANFNQMGIYDMDEQELMAINGGETFTEWTVNTINAIGEGAKNAGKAAKQVYEATKDVVKDIYDSVSDFVGNLVNSF